jgi:hypothetical protein
MRDSRWCIVDLVGKHGRVRTIPMPSWVKNAIDAWAAEAGVTVGHLFRPVNRGDQVSGERMSEKVVWQMLKTYVARAGLPDIAPHDLRRYDREVVPGGRRRVGTDSTSPRPFVSPDDGAVPRDEAGSRSRSERRDQVEAGGLNRSVLGRGSARRPNMSARHNGNRPMSHQPITAESRELLGKLRDLLLDQHKLLLDRERTIYERTSGPIAGPGAFLTLLLRDPHFAWLKQISGLVVEIDEALSRRSKAEQPVADALTAQVRELIRPREHGDDFQVHYYNAIQESPDIVTLQCRIEQLLEI